MLLVANLRIFWIQQALSKSKSNLINNKAKLLSKELPKWFVTIYFKKFVEKSKNIVS